jgi:hypothetical protein
MFGGCSASVPLQNVYGTYVATYPFGTDTITLNRDGTLVQNVVITDDPPPEIARGHWSFDSSNSYVTFDVYLSVDNGFGKLNATWRTPHHGSAASLPIEKILFRTTMGSGAQYPYIKQ